MAPLPRLNRRVLPPDRDREVQQALRWVGRASETVGDFVVDRSGARHGVLVAPSGAGKTIELSQACDAHREAGRRVAFVRANDVTGDAPAEIARITAAPFVLVIDAIDELSMDGMTFGSMLKTLGEWVPAPHMIRLILSARTGRWSLTDHRTLADSAFGAFAARVDNRPLVDIRTLDALDGENIGELAAHFGVRDLDAFLAAYDNYGLHPPLRPSDVKLLTNSWQRSRQLPPWLELFEDYVSGSLVDTSDSRQKNQALTPSKARTGLERIAAARVLSQKTFLVSSRTHGNDNLSATLLFADWTSSEISELFEHPLMVHSGDRAVQLPDGPVVDYLAACWFAKRLSVQMSQESCLSYLSVAVDGNPRIPNQWRSVLGWIGSKVPPFRRHLVEQYPDIALHEGDPSALSPTEVEQLLRGLQGNWRDRPTDETLSRLMRPELTDFVRESLARDDDPLRLSCYVALATTGGINLLPFVDRLLQHPNEEVRADVVRAVAKLPSSPDAWLAIAVADGSPLVHQTLLAHLRPGNLTPEKVLTWLAKNEDTYWSVDRWIARETPDVRLAFAQLICDGAATSSAARVLFTAVVTMLKENDDVPHDVLQMLMNRAEEMCAASDATILNSDVTEARQLLESHAPLRQGLLIHRYAQKGHSTFYTRRTSPAFGQPQIADIPLLLTPRVEWDEPATFWARQAGIRLFLEATEHQSEFQARYPELTARFEEALELQREQQARQRDHDEEERAQKLATRAKEEEILRGMLEVLRTGKHPANLAFLANKAGVWDKEPEEVSLERTEYGEDILEAAEEGFIAFWEESAAELAEPGKILTSHRLARLGFEFAQRKGLAIKGLSSEQARRATIFALSGLNQLPKYLDELARAHRPVVKGVLREVISGEWHHPADVHGAFRLMGTSGATVAALARETIVELLANGAPHNAASRGYAVDVLLTSTSDKVAILEAIARESTSTFSKDWWRLWANFDPLAAAEATAALGPEQRPQMLELLGVLANDLERRIERPFATIAGEALIRWFELALECVAAPAKQERNEYGVVRRETRFHREITEAIARSASPATREALKEFRSRAQPEWHGQLDWLLERQLGTMVDARRRAWTEREIRKLEEGDAQPIDLISEP